MIVIAYVMGPLLKQIITFQLDPLDILSLGVLRIPETIRLTMPMATLFGTLIVVGNLSSHGELTAILTGGTSFYRLLTPILAMGCVAGMVSLLTDQLLVPGSSEREMALLEYWGLQVSNTPDGLMIKEPRQGVPRRIIYIQHWTEKPLRLYGVKVYEYITTEDGNSVATEEIHAESAMREGDRWVFRNAVQYVFSSDGRTISGKVSKLIWGPGKEMPDIRGKGAKTPPHTWRLDRLSEALRRLRVRRAPMEEVNGMIVEINNKLAFPAACILLAMVGAPLGVQRQRTSTSIGLGISLVVVLIYYVVWKICSTLGENGKIEPALSSWIANILLGISGAVLIARAPK